jgi:hypothetical protein
MVPLSHLRLTSSIDTTRAIESLTTTIRGVIEESVPTVAEGKFCNMVDPNLTILSARTKRARKRMRKQYSPETQEIYEVAKRKWERAVYSAKQKYWREKLEFVSKDAIWKITKNIIKRTIE